MKVRSTAHQRVAEYGLLVLWLSVATSVVTWPHARVVASHVVSHIDPLFSMWRLAWFSHAIARGNDLLHANIFYPELYTYLLSDATFLQGALAAPAIWSGVPLPLVYNLLLLVGMVSSGVALYWLAGTLGIPRWPSVVAATVFSLAPYRIEHLMHLELQWVAFAIVALGSLYQVLYAPRWTSGAVLGLSVWLQFLSSVYYAVYLLPILVALAVCAVRSVPDRRATLRAASVAIVLGASLTLPIARIYMLQGQRVGGRSIGDIAMYSATPSSYLASPEVNILYGATADRFGSGEKRLFPGGLAILLAAIGAWSARRRVAVAALIVVTLAVDLSFGTNGLLYPRLLEWLPALHGLRVPARFGVFVLAAVAILAALGCEIVARWAQRARVRAPLVAAIAVAVACAEYRSPIEALLRVDMDPPVYAFLRQQPEGSVLELPLSKGYGDAGLDADYEFWSTTHWRKLINGYSGFYPASYAHTLDRLRSLPDAHSLAVLRDRGVRHILVHLTYFTPAERDTLLAALFARAELRSLGSFRDWAGPTAVFEVRREPAQAGTRR